MTSEPEADDVGDSEAGGARPAGKEIANGTLDATASVGTVDAVVEDDDGFFDRFLPLVEMDRRDRWIEILSAVLLALATIASAWSAYEATRWSGEQAKATSASIALRTESVRASNLANTQTTIRVGVYLDWLTAIQEDNLVRIAFLEERMGDEMKSALDAWLASADVDAGEIPEGSPFDEEFYESAASEESVELEIEADAERERSAEANQNGDNFILLTVMYASVLFFGGVSTKFRSLRVRVAVLALGVVVFIVASAFLISLPANFGV